MERTTVKRDEPVTVSKTQTLFFWSAVSTHVMELLNCSITCRRHVHNTTETSSRCKITLRYLIVLRQLRRSTANEALFCLFPAILWHWSLCEMRQRMTPAHLIGEFTTVMSALHFPKRLPGIRDIPPARPVTNRKTIRRLFSKLNQWLILFVNY